MRNKSPALIIGALLLVLGLFITAGKLFYTESDKVVDLGPLEVTSTEEKRVPLNWGYVLLGIGGITLAAGLIQGRKAGR
jgi:hypothetical protein